MSLRQRQSDAFVRMLHFNIQQSIISSRQGQGQEESYKVLILDRFTRDILSPLLKVNELRQHGVTLHFLIDSDRQTIPDVPAIYLIQPTQENIQRIVQDASMNTYANFHINFITQIPTPLLDTFAKECVQANAMGRISKVFDQHLSFVTLEHALFTLGLPHAYVDLHDPGAKDSDIERCANTIVDGLLSVFATQGVVPFIKTPKGGASEHIARLLDARLRQHISDKTGLFPQGISGAHSRPLLMLFDRNFDLSTAVRHSWTYRPLVHDLLDLSLNRVSLRDRATGKVKQQYEVGIEDFFWEDNGHHTFPKVAEEVESQLNLYKKAVDEVNSKVALGVDPFSSANNNNSGGPPGGGELTYSTKELLSAVTSLPQLRDRKNTLDKHTNIATALLARIKERSIDKFCDVEEDIMKAALGGGMSGVMSSKASTDGSAVAKIMRAAEHSPQDRLRLLLVHLLNAKQLPPQSEIDALVRDIISSADSSSSSGASSNTSMQKSSSGENDARALTNDFAAVATGAVTYIRRMISVGAVGQQEANTTNPSAAGGAMSNDINTRNNQLSLSGGGGQGSQLLSWADKTFGEGLSRVKQHMKSLLSSSKTEAVAVAVEELMDGKVTAEAEMGYVILDPRAPLGSSSTKERAGGKFNEGVVFMIGGGTYAEYQALLALQEKNTTGGGAGSTGGSGLSGNGKSRKIVYGCTNLVSGSEMVEQLATLGRKMS